MSNKQKNANPWFKNHQPKQQQTTKNDNRNHANSAAPTLSELKFKEAHKKLQAAVKKHVKEYESSSEEEELETENVIGSVLKNYTGTGGRDEYLERTKTFLSDSFLSGAATCLICISRVKRENSVWNCSECYCSFHLGCIQKWSKDSIFQQKQLLDNPVQVRQITLTWGCPKCRHDYKLDDVPEKYVCFCGKTTDPKYEPFLIPHSCGEICRKDLKPACGHKCMLLCHPGPCPPCPVTVSTTCYCGSRPAITRRCSDKEWSCGNRCGKTLGCGKHACPHPCHAGDCEPCLKKSLQKCTCRSGQKLRDCATPAWKCDKVCNKPLECGNHECAVVCHAGPCAPCPLTQPRTCPCGKTKYLLPCTEETPTCQDTCEKLLDCGRHVCNQRCHKDACGICLEIVVKSCRCGQHSKEIQCYKPYFCETKCKNMKDCNKHPCNRKCCDGNCPPCEKPCGRTLNCGTHKCQSVCHRGLCYPCNQTETVSCRCGGTSLTVSCGRKNKTKPPKCNILCSIPPDCHHPKREPHRCHFGDCPSCRQTCNKPRKSCGHSCPAQCHSAVLVKIEEQQKPSMPWEQTKPQMERRALSCPDCVVPVTVTCLGGHETCDWPCYKSQPSSCQRSCGRLLSCENHFCSYKCHLVEGAPDPVRLESTKAYFIREDEHMHQSKSDYFAHSPEDSMRWKVGGHETCDWPCYKSQPSSCQRSCGRLLSCENHFCSYKCHLVEGAPDPVRAGTNCETCESGCTKERPEGCTHACPKACHPGPCPPCKQMLRIRCHCGLNQPYVPCSDWLIVEKREEIQSCGNQCPKNFECGHRCRSNCHSGPCPDPDQCRRKVKLFCPCKRIKKDFSCDLVRKNSAKVECDSACAEKKEEARKQQEALNEQKRREEELKNQKELAKYQKMFEGKKKRGGRRFHEEEREDGLLKKYRFVIGAVLVALLAVGVAVYFIY